MKTKKNVTAKPKAKRGRPNGALDLAAAASSRRSNSANSKATVKRPPTAAEVQMAQSSSAGTPVGKSHFCDDCGKAFVSISKLARHKVVHSKVKGWSCSGCGTAFSQKSALTVHLKRRANRNRCSDVPTTDADGADLVEGKSSKKGAKKR